MVTAGAVMAQIITRQAGTPPRGALQTVTGRPQGAAGPHITASRGAGTVTGLPQGAGTVTAPRMEAQATECRGAGASWTLTACLEGAQSPATEAARGAD